MHSDWLMVKGAGLARAGTFCLFVVVCFVVVVVVFVVVVYLLAPFYFICKFEIVHVHG